MKKIKLLSLLISLFIFSGTMSMNAQTASGTCGGGLSWNYDSGTRTLTITYDGVGTGVMDDVVYEQNVPWNAYRRQIDHVVLPEGMTNLGNYACAHFNITSVSIPSTVTRVGTHCFLGCWYIPSITLPSNLQAIGDEAFSICSSLTSITIPATVTSIGYGITSACKIMETIEVAAGNTVYQSPTGSNAIVTIAAPVKLVAGCKTTVIPNNVAVIGKEAMSGQNYLPAITLPNSVTTIEQFGFDYCFSAPTLHIPANVSSIAVDAFQGCEFTSITVDANNTTFDSRNNCNAIIKKGANPQLVLGCVNTVIPSDVTSIGNNAFATLEGLTSITIPAGVTEIGGRAFASCSGLTEMTCLAVTPPAPAQWSSSHFYDVTNTIPVYVPAASLTAYQTTSPWSYFTNFQPIGGEEPVNCAPYSGSCNDYVTWSLDTCTGLLLIEGTDTMPDYTTTNQAPWAPYRKYITRIEVAEGVTFVGEYAFYRLNKVVSAKMPTTLIKLRDWAFQACSALEQIELQSVPNFFGMESFKGCNKLDTIWCPCNTSLYTGRAAYELHPYYDRLYRKCDKQHPVFYGYCGAPREATNLAWRFEDYQLTFTGSGAMADFLIGYDDYILWGDLYLFVREVSLPEGLTVIGANAFTTCRNMHKIVIPSSVTAIHQDAFYACMGMDTVFMSTPAADLTWVDDYTDVNADFKFDKATICYLPTAAMKAAYEAKFANVNVTFAGPEEEEPECTIINGACNSTVNWSLDTCSGLLLISGTDTMPNYSTFDAAPWYVYNKYITSIEVAEGITYVGDYSFYQLGHVKTAKLPTTLLKIRNRAFASCISLEKVELQSIPNYLHTRAFDVCNKLDTIFCPCGESYTGIDSYELQYFYDKLYRKCDKKHPAFYGYCGAPRVNTNLAWRFEDGLFTFTGSGAMADFLLGEEDYILWGDLNSFADSIVLPDGLTVIGANAFVGCENVHSVVIPSSVISINEDAFNGCFGMDTIFMSTPAADLTWDDDYTGDFPDFKENKATICWLPTAEMKAAYEAKFASVNVTFAGPEEEEPECTIASGALTESLNWALTCDNVLKLTGSGPMPDFNYPNYGPWNSLRHKVHALDLPAGLTTIGQYAFYQMDSLNTAVVIPEGVTSIGYCAFSGENQLPAITLPSTLQTMDGGVFSENWALQSLTIPAAVRSIGSRLTEGCTSLTSIVVDANNMVFDSRENCNAVIQTATNKLVAGCHVTVIPNTVVTIGTQAFSSLRNMTQIRIPNSVTRLDSYCFQYCSSLTDLVIPSSLVDIDGSAFAGCKFNTLSVNPGNPRYDSRDNCNAIIETATNVLIKGCNTTVIPDEIEVIGEGAFWSCWNLKFINLPETVDSIAHNGLIYCKGLESITCFAVNPPHVGPQAFNYGTETSININPAIPVYVPNPSAYQAAPGWNYFTNFIALDSYYTVKALANHGQVTGTGTYAANATVALVATPDEGFVFSQWSDGSTSNTKNFVVTCDTTLRAFFEKEEQEEQTIIAGQSTVAEVSEITISFEPIVDAVLYELKVYMHGRLVATVHINAFGQIVGDIIWAAPSRIQATTVDADPSVYQVNLSNLEFGQDYTFTLDSYNADEECISAQNGSFNVPEQETPTDCLDIQSAESMTTRKIMENGRLLIIVNDQRFDAQGQIVE